MYRFQNNVLNVLLVHPGGPFWAKKDIHAWSIPKGLYGEEEDPFEAAKREFQEETGFVCEGEFKRLDEIKHRSGKKVVAWAVEGDVDAKALRSNTFSMEWPPETGKLVEFPEVDRVEWFTIDEAAKKILKGQVGFLKGLCTLLGRKFRVPEDIAAESTESEG